MKGRSTSFNAIPRNVEVNILARRREVLDMAANGVGNTGDGLPGFRGGTQGQYLDFGPDGTTVVLHGKERVMTEAEERAEESRRPVIDFVAFAAEQRRFNDFMMNQFGKNLARSIRDQRQVERR